MIDAEGKPVFHLVHQKVSAKIKVSYFFGFNILKLVGDQNNAAVLEVSPCLLKLHFSSIFSLISC